MIAMYDVIIIGGGPAGLTAATYSARAGLKTLVLEKASPGGKLGEIPHLENFPGLTQPTNGLELAMKMYEQAIKFGAEIKYPEAVVDLDLKDIVKKVRTRSGEYKALSIIIATGLEKKKALKPGEAKLMGKGVSYCAVCDGPIFKGKDVAILGNSEKAIEETLFLSNLARKVYLITDGEKLEAPEPLIERLKQQENVEIVDAELREIIGEERVEAITVKGERKEQKIFVSAIFIAKGDEPKTEIFKKAGLELNKIGFIKVNLNQETNVPGVYAAGDCTGRGLQVVVAAGDGAVAAISANKYVKALKAKMKKVEIDEKEGLIYIEIEPGKRAYHRFKIEGKTMKMQSTYTPQEYRGLGIAGRIVDAAIKYAKQKEITKLIVECSYVERWIKNNSDKVSEFEIVYDIKA